MTGPFVPGPPLRIAGAAGGPLAGLTFAAKDLFDLHENRATWDEAVSGFAKTMLADDPTVTADVIQKFGHNMFGGDFVFSVSREFVRRCGTPLLLQPGSDTPHPAETSAEIARLAPNLEVQKDWRGPAHLAESIHRVTDFSTRQTP